MPRTLVMLFLAFFVPAAPAQTPKPNPDVADAKYGPHERNVLDFWQAKGPGPRPLVVFIHSGAFRAGSKDQLGDDLLKRCLDAGISVAAVNYRLTDVAPFPAAYLDCARAIQFLRWKAKDWNLDPARVAATGISAGASTALWIGFHDDLADPKSTDPVARQSSRLTCIAGQGASTTYDPRVIKKLIGGLAHEHPAMPAFFGITAEESATPKAYERYEKASAINYLTKDDPPVFEFYSEPNGPLPPDAKPGQGMHHPKFGQLLKEKMDTLGIECILRQRDDYQDKGMSTELNREMVEFFVKHFKMK